MAMNLSSSSSPLWNRVKPYAAVVFMQFGLAGMSLLIKNALNHGLNNYSYVVYRHIVASAVIGPFALVLERKVRPKMTPQIFAKILLLALLEPVMDQNLYFTGMKYTSATFAAALTNILPAVTFIMAWIFRLEIMNIRSIRSQAKIVGTAVTIGGAMVMTLVTGPTIPTPWNDSGKTGSSSHAISGATPENPIKGAIMMASGCMCWSSFIILQAITVKSYPAELSLTALMCSCGSVIGLAVALVIEWGNWSIWAIHLDTKLLAIVYSGIICSGIGYYLQAVIMKTRSPVFVTAFSPLTMIIVAIFSSFFLSEILSFGRLVGAIVIVTGLYLVIWGKSKDTQMASTSLAPVDSLKALSTAEDAAADDINLVDRFGDININIVSIGGKPKEESV